MSPAQKGHWYLHKNEVKSLSADLRMISAQGHGILLDNRRK